MVRTAVDLAVPKSKAAELVTQCLRQFLTEQLKKVRAEERDVDVSKGMEEDV